MTSPEVDKIRKLVFYNVASFIDLVIHRSTKVEGNAYSRIPRLNNTEQSSRVHSTTSHEQEESITSEITK